MSDSIDPRILSPRTAFLSASFVAVHFLFVPAYEPHQQGVDYLPQIFVWLLNILA